jgi:iron complex transport system ATP-binding protein
MIAGFGYPASGTLQVLGCEFGKTDLRELRRGVGWVNGDLDLEVPLMQTALETVVSGSRGSLVLYDDPSSGETTAALSALSSLGIAELAERRLGTLSSGERQAVWIARSLATNPELLILDEPCLALDPVARERFLSSLSRLLRNRPEVTAVMVTHHVEEITPEFGQVLLVENGCIVALGRKEDVLSQPVLSKVFGPNFRLSPANGRYSLDLAEAGWP